MKRLVALCMLAAFVLGTAGTSFAVEMKAKGSWRVQTTWMDNYDFSDDGADDNFRAKQRARVYFDFIASENLKAVLKLEIGDLTWGGDNGGSIGADGVNIETKNAYIDFDLPNCPVSMRAGIMGMSLPGTFASPILADDVAGVVVDTAFSDMASLTLGWARPYDGQADDGQSSSYDVAFAILPVTMDEFDVTPFFAYGFIGSDRVADTLGSFVNADNDTFAALTGVADDKVSNYITSEEDATAWWAGVNANINMFDPIVVKFDFNYGSMSLDEVSIAGGNSADLSMKGWYTALAVDYKMDMVTPELFFTYASGDSDADDDDFDVMPVISTDSFAPTPFLFAGSTFSDGDGLLQAANIGGNAFSGMGLWTLGLRLKNISFMDKLSHEFVVAYVQGTNDKDWADLNTGGIINVFTEDDSAIEVDFHTKYMIYDNLAAIVELGYAKLDMEETTARGDDFMDDAAYKALFGLKYDF